MTAANFQAVGARRRGAGTGRENEVHSSHVDALEVLTPQVPVSTRLEYHYNQVGHSAQCSQLPNAKTIAWL